MSEEFKLLVWLVAELQYKRAQDEARAAHVAVNNWALLLREGLGYEVS
jgi:hypothetical protein